MLVRIEGPDFTAGLILRDGVCVEAAPVISWAVGVRMDALWVMFNRRQWRATVVE